MTPFELNTLDALERRCAFYSTPAMLDNPHHPAGFKGTWAVTDHKLIPDVLRGYLQRHFGIMRLNRVKIEDINIHLNTVWTGPGSLEQLFREEHAMQVAGREIKFTVSDLGSAVKDTDDVGPLSSFGLFDNSEEEPEQE